MTIKREQYEEFLVMLYFGREKNRLKACLDRAYRDFNRTLHGIGSLANATAIHAGAVDLMLHAFNALKNISLEHDAQSRFDGWHRETCESLMRYYHDQGYAEFHYGQAQKWINMTLKYIFTMGEERVPGFTAAYPFCHIPLDSIILKILEEKYQIPYDGSWSRMNYEDYMEIQKAVRTYSNRPLDLEFGWFMEDREIEQAAE